MNENDTLGMTNGYPYPRPFQPQGKAQLRGKPAVKKPLANTKKSVIKVAKGRKPIVKKKQGK